MMIEFYEVNWLGKPNGVIWGTYELLNVPQKGDGITLPDFQKIDHYFRVIKHHYHPAENLVCVGLRLVGQGIAPNTVSS